MSRKRKKKIKQPAVTLDKIKIRKAVDPDTDPDWTHTCDLCGQAPVVPVTGMCGPCTFGESETAGGNW